MKRFFALLLALVLALGLAACGNSPDAPDPTDPPTKPSAEQNTVPPTDPPTNPPTNPPTDPEPTVDPVIQQFYDNEFAEAVMRLDWGIYSITYPQDGAYVTVEGADALHWVYETALELAQYYTEAAEVADRFIILEDVLLHQRIWHEDRLGNLIEDSEWGRSYLADGTQPSVLNVSEEFGPKDKYRNNHGKPEYTYDEAGRVITVRFFDDYYSDRVNCVIDYTYDENGVLVSEHYLDSEGWEFTTTYEYGENGLPVLAKGCPCSYQSNTAGIAYYTYDEQDRLTSICAEENYGNLVRKHITDYVYDEAGNLISIRDYRRDDYSTWPNNYSTEPEEYDSVRIWNYEYDESGRVIRHTYTNYGICDSAGNPINEKAPTTYIVDYTYGTYIQYTPVE